MRDVSVKPYSTLTSGEIAVPLYILTYDKLGNCTSPSTLGSVIEGVRDGTYEHVHVFAHGWNNVFEVAKSLFENFFGGYLANRLRARTSCTPLDRTAFVGIVWPSTALVAPSEATPKIAALTTAGAEIDELQRSADALAEELPRDAQRELRELLTNSSRPGDFQRVAQLLRPIFERPHDETAAADVDVKVEDVVRVARAAGEQFTSQGRFDEQTDAQGYAAETEMTEPAAAAWSVPNFDPRWIVRVASVLLMKDRAGTVGAGVGPSLIAPILSSSQCRVHGVGHSYGTKVLLSSICAHELARPIDSLLLLEPAISRLCFASHIGGGRAGGYRRALERVIAPIFSTWSSEDRELRLLYQLAVRRAVDIGDQRIAGIFDRYEALGGYGPAGLEPGEHLPMMIGEPGDLYPRDSTARLYSLDGSKDRIRSHGDIASDYTEWAQVVLVDGAWQR